MSRGPICFAMDVQVVDHYEEKEKRTKPDDLPMKVKLVRNYTKSTAQAGDTDDVPECHCSHGKGTSRSHNPALAATYSQDGEMWLHPKNMATGKDPKGQVDPANGPCDETLRYSKQFKPRNFCGKPQPCTYPAHKACGNEGVYFFNFAVYSHSLLDTPSHESGHTWYQHFHDMVNNKSVCRPGCLRGQRGISGYVGERQ